LKPFLSLLFIDHHDEYERVIKEVPPEVECISLASVNFIKDVDKLNYAIRMANGKYVCLFRSGDVLINDFVNEVLKHTGTKKDVILFESVDSNGIITTYTTSLRTGNYLNTENISLIQYFHPVLRTLVNNVMFNDIDKNRDIYAMYSKKVNSLIFNYANTKKILLKHDTV